MLPVVVCVSDGGGGGGPRREGRSGPQVGPARVRPGGGGWGRRRHELLRRRRRAAQDLAGGGGGLAALRGGGSRVGRGGRVAPAADRLLCPHCSSTSPPVPAPLELGEAVSEESDGWWWWWWLWWACAWSRAGLQAAADEDDGCGARARSGLESSCDDGRYDERRELSAATAMPPSSSLQDLDAGFRVTLPLPPPPPLASGRQSGLSLWYLQ